MKRSIIACLIACLLSVPAAAAPQTLTIHNGPEPEAIDPHLVSAVDSSNLSIQLFEGLVIVHPTKKGAVMPGVAEKWDISPDGKTYIFYLRKNATWSDGSPLSARDFLSSWRRAIDPKTACPQASRFNYIKNGKDFINGKIKDPSVLGFKVLNDTTFQVELEGPFPPFLELLTKPTFAPVKENVVQEHGDTWTKPEYIVSNGAFVLKTWIPYDRIVLAKNTRYWDAKNVQLDEVTLLTIDELETVLKRYEAGDIDFLYRPPQTKIPTLANRADFYSSPSFGEYYYALNVKHPILQDQRVRRALALAIDRETLTKRVVRGKDIPATGFIPAGVPGYPYKKHLSFDPQQAKKLLADAGYPEGKGFPSLTITYNTMEQNRLVAEAIQQMWKQHLGLDVRLQNQEWKVHIAAMRDHNFEIGRMGGIGEYLYPTTFAETFVTGSPGNYSQWIDPRYDQIWEAANREANLSKRLQMYRQLEDMIMEAMPIIPIYNYAAYWMIKPHVKNLALLPGHVFLLKYASVQ